MRAWFQTKRLQLSKLSLWWIAVPLYALALMLPAVEIGGSDLFGHATATQAMPGAWCLGIGLLAPTPAWANSALALGAILAAYQKPRAAMIFTLLAVVMSASTLLFIQPHGRGLFALRGVHIGFWFWLASCVVMLWARIRALSPQLRLDEVGLEIPDPAIAQSLGVGDEPSR